MAAIDIISQPAELSFSSSLDDIVVATTYESVDVVLTIHGDNVIEETLVPDLGGKICLSDLSPLAEPYAREHHSVVMNCQFSKNGYSASISPVTVLYCKADVCDTAEHFLSSHFLTLLDGEKLTGLNRQEALSAYQTEEVDVTAEVVTALGEFRTMTARLTADATNHGMSLFNVSPRKIIGAIGLVGGRLLSYTVTAGSRRQEFRCMTEQVLPEPSLVFVNSFGCEEFLHCSGTLKRSSKFDRQSGRAKSRLLQYAIIEERQFVANTGWLNDSMADWAEELFRSDEVYLWSSGRGHEVVITDSKSDITNEDDELTAYEFTYTYAQRINNVIRRRRTSRIFSDTFEAIYN